MKICLIVPPTGFELDERVWPSLGILKVAAVLEREGHHVRVVDLMGVDDYELSLRLSSDAHFADVYGITATTPQMPAAARISNYVRGLGHERSIVMLGGPHPTLMNAAAKLEKKRGRPGRACEAMRDLSQWFDVIVCGDGERAVLQAVEHRGFDCLIVDADDRKSVLFLKPQDLAEEPLPARHLIDLPSYHYTIAGQPSTSMIAQLGCPFGCAFCGGRNSAFLRTIRTRPSASVVAEVEHLHREYGYRAFMLLDDELNVSPSFMELLDALSDLQYRLGVNLYFRGLVKSELFTQEMANRMQSIGFTDVMSGFESGDDRILANMNKRATVADNTRALEHAKNAGLRMKALMSLGHAGESLQSIDNTRRWLLDVQPEEFDATIITVYPGTPYHDEAVETSPGVWTFTAKNGDRLHARQIDQFTDQPFYKGVPGRYESFVWTDHVSAKDLVQARDALETDVRSTLKIPWPRTAAELQFEHSMGAR